MKFFYPSQLRFKLLLNERKIRDYSKKNFKITLFPQYVHPTKKNKNELRKIILKKICLTFPIISNITRKDKGRYASIIFSKFPDNIKAGKTSRFEYFRIFIGGGSRVCVNISRRRGSVGPEHRHNSLSQSSWKPLFDVLPCREQAVSRGLGCNLEGEQRRSRLTYSNDDKSKHFILSSASTHLYARPTPGIKIYPR